MPISTLEKPKNNDPECSSYMTVMQCTRYHIIRSAWRGARFKLLNAIVMSRTYGYAIVVKLDKIKSHLVPTHQYALPNFHHTLVIEEFFTRTLTYYSSGPQLPLRTTDFWVWNSDRVLYCCRSLLITMEPPANSGITRIVELSQ